MNGLVHAYDLKYGSVYIYSENLNTFRPHIENAFDNVECALEYCKHHQINACYISNHHIIGICEYMKVIFIMKRFGFMNDKYKFFEFIGDNRSSQSRGCLEQNNVECATKSDELIIEKHHDYMFCRENHVDYINPREE